MLLVSSYSILFFFTPKLWVPKQKGKLVGAQTIYKGWYTPSPEKTLWFRKVENNCGLYHNARVFCKERTFNQMGKNYVFTAKRDQETILDNLNKLPFALHKRTASF